ncbi:hypothetical protein GUITHDRAFT_113783 [Guillardia theta CCMP2712]|uniref:Uncharacterized protein n=1 Tax=Guillardia theta (strain CCMP2712) TaxID=905079 RepID=L1IW20_GUITC|nr:hypothetical protein GUITHDRAFT_113783 [Guillardia theta CCMP2712]EKX40045.1 hypothetical protein GUITHDRAFT_113783 [Guillardia theta CCMP2712]|eukprot:XP_005827025.1 hypothetical protein GUITHDRAFT_113783 [Guillardia theta CCMP2712]
MGRLSRLFPVLAILAVGHLSVSEAYSCYNGTDQAVECALGCFYRFRPDGALYGCVDASLQNLTGYSYTGGFFYYVCQADMCNRAVETLNCSTYNESLSTSSGAQQMIRSSCPATFRCVATLHDGLQRGGCVSGDRVFLLMNEVLQDYQIQSRTSFYPEPSAEVGEMQASAFNGLPAYFVSCNAAMCNDGPFKTVLSNLLTKTTSWVSQSSKKCGGLNTLSVIIASKLPISSGAKVELGGSLPSFPFLAHLHQAWSEGAKGMRNLGADLSLISFQFSVINPTENPREFHETPLLLIDGKSIALQDPFGLLAFECFPIKELSETCDFDGTEGGLYRKSHVSFAAMMIRLQIQQGTRFTVSGLQYYSMVGPATTNADEYLVKIGGQDSSLMFSAGEQVDPGHGIWNDKSKSLMFYYFNYEGNVEIHTKLLQFEFLVVHVEPSSYMPTVSQNASKHFLPVIKWHSRWRIHYDGDGKICEKLNITNVACEDSEKMETVYLPLADRFAVNGALVDVWVTRNRICFGYG